MKTTNEKNTFGKRLKSMISVDFRRMFTMPLYYIMAGICLVLPILILVMTSSFSDGATESSAMFTNVWQTLGGSSAGMDIAGMCNINMLYFIAAIFVCLFISDDFKSGYAKNLFAVRPKKTDYVISKTLSGFVGSATMLAAYLIGSLIGGAIAGLPFDTGTAGVGGIIACFVSKVFLMNVFVAVFVAMSAAFKQKTWMSLIGSFVVCMLMFMMVPMITPLDSGIINVVGCFVGGLVFAFGLGAVSNVILNKTNLI